MVGFGPEIEVLCFRGDFKENFFLSFFESARDSSGLALVIVIGLGAAGIDPIKSFVGFRLRVGVSEGIGAF